MIEVESEGNLVTLRMIGVVTSSDWDWRGLELWEPGARSDCTWFCMGNRDLVGRIAILGSPRWHDEKDRLTDIYQKAEVKVFTSTESNSAVVWLTGE